MKQTIAWQIASITNIKPEIRDREVVHAKASRLDAPPRRTALRYPPNR